ncbi:hypothetical protein [Paenisporosarcina cavernae]|uniref:Short-chain dehydrogenase n=1 Tax=Paenisporosarcina cavernae TaxID=2320858 RepID=A0A385YQP6_9BACL|nr:hypothetical protein [Paenisporosarcina cavernae]AYC29075.1 hypothetical protein D3873_03980 [Paenisporosarcina cavernae]
MGMWTVPLLIAIVIISAIALYTTMRVLSFEQRRNEAMDSPIPEEVKEHPIVLNPIIWAYLVAFIFIMLVIGYSIAANA